MRTILALVLVFSSAAAMAQGAPPTVGGKPLVQVKPKAAAAKPNAAAAKPQSIAAKLQACLEIDEATKERLTCYDGIFAPQPKPKPAAADLMAETGRGLSIVDAVSAEPFGEWRVDRPTGLRRST